MAKWVWALREDDAVVPMYGDETSDPKLWLFNWCSTLKQDQFIEVLVTLWAIWWVRRKVIHENEYQSPLSTHLFISGFLDKIREPKTPAKHAGQRPERGVCKWIPPVQGEAKLNADVALAKSVNRGAAEVVC